MKDINESRLWLAALLLSAGLLAVQYLPGVQPYKNVQIVSVLPIAPGYRVVTDFEKLQCEFSALFVFGVNGEIQTALNWQNSPQDHVTGDRVAGFQRLAIDVYTGDLAFDALEIRTRHLCDGDKVDRVFARIPL